jgi:D-alanine--poly(phosphoribitol) ligase subunit 1
MFQEFVLSPFIQSVRKFGDNQAFCINGIFYTYNDLADQISKIRKALTRHSCVSKNIGLVANDDIYTYASIFAIWLEGLAYVPLHPHQPFDRSTEIIDQAEIELIIDSTPASSFSAYKHIISLNLPAAEISLEPSYAKENDLAYILFTSGSTGKPKGVPLMRSNVGAFMKSFFKAGFSVTENDRCLQCFDLTFDVSVQSYLTALVNGACVYTIPHDQIKYSYVFGLMDDHQLTFGVMAPSMIRYLRPYFNEILCPSMRYCILTAEASPADLVAEWADCIPNAEIFDYYGPTEATIYCTYYKCPADKNYKHLNGMLSIGKPMDGLTALILDDNKNILGKNEKGELCIAGNQLTGGYWKNPEKNTESFFYMPVNGQDIRFYKTGDLCYFDDEGDIMYSGRIDFQVKIQGYRIELGEIEHHSRFCNGGGNAIAVPFENKNGNTEIALFVEGNATQPSVIIDYLKSKLPYYMIPGRVINIDVLPLNTNGKIDRKKLKELI